ncbi:ABC transporter ATP-binding protein [Paenibacillus sp. FSL H8-0332]|uniref:ABC transporter ATP-binding protein n=1 Tax=Paenibacillus sp. FSL H8-0332 TaxID=2954742 RepID=UPI0030CACF96
MTIILQDVNKSYKGKGIETQILHNINATFDRNDLSVIVGASGSGKSTLLNLIGTLDSPTLGKIEFDCIDISTLKGKQMADFRFDNIGFIFQQFNLIPSLTAIENVCSPFFGRRTLTAFKKRAMDLLEIMGIPSKANFMPSQLSGGEQQRVAIARALVNEPSWLLADEPTGNLDSKNSEIFYQTLHHIKSNLGCGIIVVTHDAVLASKGDCVIEIKDGRIIDQERDVVGAPLC